MTDRDAHASGSLTSRWLVWLQGPLTSGFPQRLLSTVRSRWIVIVPSLVAFCGVAAVLVYVVSAGSAPSSPRPRSVAYASPNPDTTEPVPTCFSTPQNAVAEGSVMLAENFSISALDQGRSK